MGLSESGEMGAITTERAKTTYFWNGQTGDPIAAMVLLPDDQHLLVSADGHYQATEDIEQDLVYVVQTDEGQETLTPQEFSERYGWKNDPQKVRLFSGESANPPESSP